jgi:hypothetical protein
MDNDRGETLIAIVHNCFVQNTHCTYNEEYDLKHGESKSDTNIWLAVLLREKFIAILSLGGQ